MATKLPLIVIVGPTASGKTGVAIELAKKLGGEIICADSRTVYKGMDVGTAKPSLDEQDGVPHWGLDLVEPGERFTAADFQNYAIQKITEIRRRGHVPFLVGGTGLYVDGVAFAYEFGSGFDRDFRERLTSMTIGELHRYCDIHNIRLPVDDKNHRRLVRAIEQENMNTRRRDAPIENTIIVGIATKKDVLNNRIVERTEQLFDHGVVEEATILGKKYGWNNEAMTGNVYPLVHAHLEGEMTLQEVKDKFTTLDRRLAKRQLTWFRANPWIEWLELTGVSDHVSSLVATEQKV